jgi:hypothetical protein
MFPRGSTFGKRTMSAAALLLSCRTFGAEERALLDGDRLRRK